MLDAALFEIEKAVIDANEPGPHGDLSPWAQAMTVADGRASDHKGRLRTAYPPKQAETNGEVVAGEVEEHEMPTVVHLRIEVNVAKTRPHPPLKFLQRVELLTASPKATYQQPEHPMVRVHHAHACRVKAWIPVM